MPNSFGLNRTHGVSGNCGTTGESEKTVKSLRRDSSARGDFYPPDHSVAVGKVRALAYRGYTHILRSLSVPP
jgi:hypothetical protein